MRWYEWAGGAVAAAVILAAAVLAGYPDYNSLPFWLALCVGVLWAILRIGVPLWMVRKNKKDEPYRFPDKLKRWWE